MNIPYRNPANAPVDSIPEGWRLLLEEEFPFKNERDCEPIGRWFRSHWDISTHYNGKGSENTYITNRPLPHKYQQPPIPWYNPKNITQEQLQPELGWRFLVEGEASGTDCEWMNVEGIWRPTKVSQAYFVSKTGERTRRPLPSQYRDPDYFSEEYQVEVFKAWRFNRYPKFKLQVHGSSGWTDCDVLSWGLIANYRIKPADPVYRDEPLTDYRVSEVIRVDGKNAYIIKAIIDGVVLKCDRPENGLGGNFTPDWLVQHGEIHRNGEWQMCSNRVEVKA